MKYTSVSAISAPTLPPAPPPKRNADPDRPALDAELVPDGGGTGAGAESSSVRIRTSVSKLVVPPSCSFSGGTLIVRLETSVVHSVPNPAGESLLEPPRA